MNNVGYLQILKIAAKWQVAQVSRPLSLKIHKALYTRNLHKDRSTCNKIYIVTDTHYLLNKQKASMSRSSCIL